MITPVRYSSRSNQRAIAYRMSNSTSNCGSTIEDICIHASEIAIHCSSLATAAMNTIAFTASRMRRIVPRLRRSGSASGSEF